MDKSINIIGISGKKNSGKDTVAKIIQYLTCKEKDNYKDFFDWEMYYSSLIPKSKWKIKKFADKLKQILAILINCSLKDLEDKEFKNKELSKEWWIYVNADNMSIAYYDDVTNETLAKWKRKSLYFKLIKHTPRTLLQTIGTDLFRNKLHPDIWINATFNNYNKKPNIVSNSSDMNDFNNHLELISNNNWIITDVRFPNEVKAIKDRGGIIIRCNRFIDNDSIHYSEKALDYYNDWDIILDNTNTIENLIKQIETKLFKNGK